MPAQWTADIIGQLHLHKIAKKELAQKIGVTPEYVSMVLNGHRDPRDAQEKFRQAVCAIIAERQKSSASQS